MKRRRLAFAALLVAGGAALASCSGLASPAVITWGRVSLDVEDLRRIYAEMRTGNRPALSSRPDRLAFANDVISRRLLAERGRTLRTNDSAFAQAMRRDREDILVRRLQAIEGGQGDPTEEELAVAKIRMKRPLSVRRIFFADRAAAERGAAALASGASFESFESDSSCRVAPPETWNWIPWPVDPLVDAAIALEPGQTSAPIESDGFFHVVRLFRLVDPGIDAEPIASRLAEAVRRRKRADAALALERRLREAVSIEINEEARRLVATRVRAAILESGLAENDPGYAVPVFSPEEETRVLARLRSDAVGDLEISTGEVSRGPVRSVAGRRFLRGGLDATVRRSLEQAMTRRLFLAEATRRGLERDWWVERETRRLEDDAFIRAAIDDIERAVDPENAVVDSITTILTAAEPTLLRQPERARLVRADFASREAAEAERVHAIRAGGMLARFAQILDGAVVSEGSYHLLRLLPGGLGTPEVEDGIFRRAPGVILGPHAFGPSWMLLECLGVEPGRERTAEEIRVSIRENLREGRRSSGVEQWIRSRREEVGVVVNEDLLDELAPGV